MHPLRRHQEEALAALRGKRRAWVVLPPGAGKTLTGLEAARRLGEPAVAFVPNTAIQGQWLREADGLPLKVHTYQALASFDPDAEVDEQGGQQGGHLRRLRPQGRALVETLKGLGRVTLLLDECHHLLDTWGELIAEVLGELPDATVIGLTATPPDRMTAEQAELVSALFGPVIAGPSIPALVREGFLAPFAELAWLTTPTAAETQWLAGEAERFAELTTDLLDTSFLTWLDQLTALPWGRFEREQPDLAAAALRFVFKGLLALPEGARLREEHRHDPTAADWVCLLDRYVRRHLRQGPEVEAIRRALPSVGYQLTARGIRGGRSPIDRVLARSAAKTGAVREILAAEHAALGDRLRAVVLCDHERATATLPARLVGVLDEQAGSARLVLEELAADPRTAALEPMLVTGKTVAAPAATARAFAAFCDGVRLDPLPQDGVVEITGTWDSRRWVALATRFFEAGGTRALIGTRAMLGEGWDARGVNALVDLTEATTATSVVQTRGRALRLDPAWLDKVANTWSVVCVTQSHPKGDADWSRFVRKHEGYFGVTDAGEVMDGVAHVHPSLSPFAPPPEAGFERFNAMMLTRAGERARVRDLWRIGEPYEDTLVHTLRIIPNRSAGTVAAVPHEPPAVVPTATGVRPVPGGGWPVALLAGGAAAVAGAVLVAGPVGLLAGPVAGWAAREVRRAVAGRRTLDGLGPDPDLVAMAFALADGLHAAGLVPRGSQAVLVEPDEVGAFRVELDGVSASASACFVTAFDELISPPESPRYLLPRYIVGERGWWAGWRAASRRPLRNRVVYHAVPAVLGEHRKLVDHLARAWLHWVCEAEPVFTRNPEGTGVLAAQRGMSPLDATTALRVTWC